VSSFIDIVQRRFYPIVIIPLGSAADQSMSINQQAHQTADQFLAVDQVDALCVCVKRITIIHIVHSFLASLQLYSRNMSLRKQMICR
jgi:hypothetical protein